MSYPLRLLFVLSSLFLALAAGLRAQSVEDLLEVRSVEFDQLRNDWVEMVIELDPGENILSDAVNADFIERVRVKVGIAWLTDEEETLFFQSEVEIIALEKNETSFVRFYLPGIIDQIYDLDRPEVPRYYMVELSIDGQTLPMGERNVPKDFAGNAQVLESFRTQLSAQAPANDGILRPSYLVPFAELDDEPTYFRYIDQPN